MSQVTYPFDPTGQNPDCLVKNEIHTLTEINAAPYRILIPEFAPFYLNNLKVEHISTTGVPTLLDEGHSYFICLPYMAASRSVGKSVYGGLAMVNNHTNGSIRLTYQTLGGEWIADRNYAYQALLEYVFNPRTTWWDKITNVQEIFPPIDHDQNLDEVSGLPDLLASLQEVRQAILQGGSTSGSMAAHMLSKNPHGLTASDLGIKNTAFLERATDQEVMALSQLDKSVTLRQIVMLINSL